MSLVTHDPVSKKWWTFSKDFRQYREHGCFRHENSPGNTWLRNDNWKNQNAPISSLWGVITDNDTVVGINLPSNNLTGVLPGSLNELPLTYLDLSMNSISGDLPGQLASLNLQFVNLSGNLFGGQLGAPFFYVDAQPINRTLQTLDLSHNRWVRIAPSYLFEYLTFFSLDTIINHLVITSNQLLFLNK